MPSTVAVAIELTDDERAQLESWTRRRTSAQALALRSRIVLVAAEGLNEHRDRRASSGSAQHGRASGARGLPSIGWTG